MAASVPELMAEARAEQALIAAQLRALKGESDGGGDRFSPYSPSLSPGSPGGPGASPRPSPSSPAAWEGASPTLPGMPGMPAEELSALRAHVAELDHELVQRDCAIEDLQAKLKEVQEALEKKALLSPAEGGLWKDRYQTAQKESEIRGREVKELKLKMEIKEKEVRLLSQYVRKLEEEARESEQQQLVSRLHGLEEAFARCVGRVTQALTAGVVGVSLAAREASVPRFVLLTPRPGTALLEVFEEPDSNWELVAVELKSDEKNPPVTLDEKNLCLMISGIFSGMAETSEGSLAMKCQDQASFTKWSLAFRDIMGITDLMATQDVENVPESSSPVSGRSTIKNGKMKRKKKKKKKKKKKNKKKKAKGRVQKERKGESEEAGGAKKQPEQPQPFASASSRTLHQ
eukprot:Skav222339  [mRNA]  locus=scaffold3497:8438:13390:- [translate_table: standard]